MGLTAPTPRHEDVWGSEGIVARVRNLGVRIRILFH
jgi:hypothetical protein